MPEPTTAAVVTLTAAGVTMPILTAFGVPLGLRPDLLLAGFSGSLVAIVLLNSVPNSGDSWQELLRTAQRRTAVALASSLTAGYLTPLLLLMANVPDALMLSMAFATGACAQKLLISAIKRVADQVTPQGGAS